MTGYYLYHVVILILMLAVSVLIKLLYDRLELKENRCLFIATHGVSVSLFSELMMCHMTTIETARLMHIFSIFGSMLFGMGFTGYLYAKYGFKWARWYRYVWATTIFLDFLLISLFPADNPYLTDCYIKNINGINVYLGQRGYMYYIHRVAVMILGTWGFVSIHVHSLKNKDKKPDGGNSKFNDYFFITAIFIQGAVAMVYEFIYEDTFYIVPLFRASVTMAYAILSVKYHLLNYDTLARNSLMNDIGAGFIVLNDKFRALFANDVAEDVFPEVKDVELFSEAAKQMAVKKEFQLEKAGVTYKITVDRILTEKGKVGGYTILMVDISDLIQLENQAVINEIARKNLLTNISHELRTPLNTIIGASDMMTSGDNQKDTYTNYAEKIKTAAVNLDDILNDILTASSEYEKTVETESVPYSMCTLVDNIAQMACDRVADKKIKFTLSMAEDIPINAMGDDRRVRQAVLTVLTNAIRYTDEGSISLKVSGEYLPDNRFKYIYTISDTGRTVYKDGVDINKVISTGNELGVDYTTGYSISLMVAKKILTSMGGGIDVKSLKGKGNVYTISVPSEIIARKTMTGFEFSKEMKIDFIGEANDEFDEIWRSCHNLGIKTEIFAGTQLIRRLTDEEAASGFKNILFFDFKKYGKRVVASEKAKKYVKVAVISDDKIPEDYRKDFIFVRNPVSSITLYKVHLEYEQRLKALSANMTSLVAPAAKVLVVDDISINLDIALGILERFKVSVDLCSSGYECLDLIESGKKYDLIFMDYMMEGLDGIETTKRIRQMEGPNKDIPILAYTANSVEGAKEKYLEGGMNGVIYKPANTLDFAKALKEFLPKELCVYSAEPSETDKEEVKAEYPSIDGVDKETAIKYSGGNAELYAEMLGSFVMEMETNERKILDYLSTGNYKNFTVTIHGIKGLSRTLGIISLSERMADMEKAGMREDLEYIKVNIESLLSEYKKYKVVLLPYAKEKDLKNAGRVPKDEVEGILLKMKELLDDFEMDETEKLFTKLWPGEYDEVQAPIMKRLKESIEKVDYYASKDYVDEMLKTYE